MQDALKEMNRKCFVCEKELKTGEGIEKVCTTNCGVDVLTLCNKCYNSEYGDGK
jgi:predicted RNA-binding Zn-ribbon protein involved in translation (DUF1610 family)